MKILYLTKYSRMGGSSRMRSYQYFPFLEKQGMNITVKPLFGDRYLSLLYSSGNPIQFAVLGYIKRFFVLFTVFRYERIVIEKELFPYLPATFEILLSFFGVKYIVDYDDAIFHNYDKSSSKLIRFFLSNKIDKVIKYSGKVIVGNSYLHDRASDAGGKNISILPTVVDFERYSLKTHSEKITVNIGWIGTKSTFEKHYLLLTNVIQRAQQNLQTSFVVIGAASSTKLSNVEFVEWNEESEVSSLLGIDIGIMPLRNSHWEMGKCAYKLIQYMACGIPVIASPVGMNIDVVDHDVDGFLAKTEEEWYDDIKILVLDYRKRKEFGLKGRDKVREHYSLQVTQNILYDILVSKY